MSREPGSNKQLLIVTTCAFLFAVGAVIFVFTCAWLAGEIIRYFSAA